MDIQLIPGTSLLRFSRKTTLCVSTQALCSILRESHLGLRWIAVEKRPESGMRVFQKVGLTRSRAPSLKLKKQNTKMFSGIQLAQSIKKL